MPRNLLVVDDSPTIRDAVRYALAGENWNVMTAADTAEALEAVGEGAIDAVLCDASLAPDDGYDACRALRSAMGDEAVPIVLMGGKVSENLAASAGATAVLTKPFESQELLDLLRTEVEERSFDMASDDFGSGEDDDWDSDTAEQALPIGEQSLDLGLEDFAPSREREILEPAPMSGAPAPAEEPSFELTSQDFALAEGDEALEPAAEGSGAIVEDEVEVIDLSDDEDAEELELIQDLEPVAAGPAPRWESEDRVRPLDLGEHVGIEEADTGLRHGGAVEFDLADLGGEEEEATTESAEELAFGETSSDEIGLGLDETSDRDLVGTLSETAPSAASEGLVEAELGASEDLDLEDLDLDLGLELEPASPATFGTAGESQTPSLLAAEETETPTEADDLLEDIDLEGWAEETASSPAATTAESGPAWTGAAVEEPIFSGDDTISAEEGAEDALPLDEETLAIEDEDELPLRAEQQAEPEAAPETEPSPPSAAEEPVEEDLEDWSQFEEAGVGEERPVAASVDEEILAAVQSSSVEMKAELEGFEEPEELPLEAEAEAVETDATWAEPAPAPSGGVPWDLEPLPSETSEEPPEEPRLEAISEPVARAAEEAVRQALAESLSPQALTPVVEAVVERVVWEVVPQLAERLIREAIERLQQEPAAD